MTAITVPFVGDRVPDGYPSVIKVVKVTTGCATAVVDVASSSQAAYDLVTLPAGAHIVDVGWRVSEAFTGAVTLTLGDTGDAAGWALTSDILSTTVGTHIVTSRDVFLAGLAEQMITSDAADTTTASTVWQEPQYAAPTTGQASGYTIQGATRTIDMTVGGADPAVGKLEVYVYYHMAFGQKST